MMVVMMMVEVPKRAPKVYPYFVPDVLMAVAPKTGEKF
jgi:hypothetical protein